MKKPFDSQVKIIYFIQFSSEKHKTQENNEIIFHIKGFSKIYHS